MFAASAHSLLSSQIEVLKVPKKNTKHPPLIVLFPTVFLYCFWPSFFFLGQIPYYILIDECGTSEWCSIWQ